MKDYKLKQRNLRASHTLGYVSNKKEKEKESTKRRGRRNESGKPRGVGNSGRGSMRTLWLLSCARVVRFTQIDFLFVLYSTLLLHAA
jgi:hypothetical protein